MRSRFDRPGPDSDVDAWWEDHGRYMRQPEPRRSDADWIVQTCADCGDEFGAFERYEWCYRCMTQRIARAADAMRAVEVKS